MRSSSVLWGLALALVVLVVLLWRLQAPAIGKARAPEEARADLAAAHVEPVPDPAAVEGGAPQSSPGNPRRAAIEPPTSRAPTCRIRVVDSATKAPVPGARVWVQRADVDVDSSRWWKAMRRSNDVELALRSGLGDELALDERAEARVPRPERERIVAAARDALHGEATLEAGAAECVIELRPYHALAIEVVDRAQRPLPGALVALYWGEFDPLEDTSTWTADDEGRVWFPKLEEQVWLGAYRGPVRVSLGAGVRGEPEVVQFTLDTVPAEPVRLVAGDHARVVLQLVDARGEELALEGNAHLELETERLEDPSLAVRAGSDLQSTLTSGRAVFETVGLGLTLDVMIAAEGYSTVWRDTVPGPTTAGQELRVLVPVGERLARARGRVHGIGTSLGEPATVRAALTGQSSRKRWIQFWARVEEGVEFDGPIHNATDLGAPGEPWTLELSRGRTAVRASAVPVLDEGAGVLDFGEVSFERLPELVRVLVRDDTGAAVPDARVETEAAPGDRPHWSDERGASLVTGPLTDLPMRIRATHHDWLPSDWVRIDAPGSETALVLRRGAVVLGRLLLSPAGRCDDFEVHLRIQPPAPGSEAQVAVTVPVEGGRFRLAPCEPGRATLTVFHDGQSVLERPGIELAPEVRTELEPIDLRGVLHSFALALELASGEPWKGGHLEVREPDGQLSTWRTIGPSARTSFLSPRSSVDVWVAACGARATLFENVLDGDRLALQPAPSVRLRLPAEVRPPEPPLALLVRGVLDSEETPEFETYDGVDTEDALVGEDGTAWLRVSWPGTYRLVWLVRHAGTGVEREIEQAEAQTVEVRETSGVPLVEARLSRDELERAVRE
jgi:hypothetical protein